MLSSLCLSTSVSRQTVCLSCAHAAKCLCQNRKKIHLIIDVAVYLRHSKSSRIVSAVFASHYSHKHRITHTHARAQHSEQCTYRHGANHVYCLQSSSSLDSNMYVRCDANATTRTYTFFFSRVLRFVSRPIHIVQCARLVRASISRCRKSHTNTRSYEAYFGSMLYLDKCATYGNVYTHDVTMPTNISTAVRNKIVCKFGT